MAEESTTGPLASAPPGRRPKRIVAIGGGNGLPAVLRGLRPFVDEGEADDLIAVVAMSDDGGSSGRLRRGRGVPPPGDVRNCLLALSEEEDLLAGLFRHRYRGSGELGGHSLGNLILAALSEQKGSFLRAVEASSLVLRTRGRILPVTTQDVVLTAELDDGTTLVGESTIGTCDRAIRAVALRPADAEPTPGVVEAIGEAELVAIGPGSLFTSVIPNLVLPEVAAALRATRATRVLVGNLVGERGEAAGLSLEDHLGLIERHAGGRVVDAIVVHEGVIDRDTLDRYRAEGAAPLRMAVDRVDGRPVFRGNLLGPGPKLRHDPEATAAALLRAWRALRAA